MEELPVEPPYEFSYSSKDFILQTTPWTTDSAPQHSQFDKALCGRWDEKMRKGVFRYSIGHLLTRILPGPKKYVAQLNEKRAKERRKPQDILSVNQPFNPDIFNFTKISDKEIVFYLRKTDEETTSVNNDHTAPVNDSADKQTKDRNMVIVNVSPLEYGHVLIVPQLDQHKPQVLTETAIKVGLEMILLSQHRGFKLGFNSLCAYASVNHLHMHAYYLEHELMVEHCEVETLGYGVYELTAMPCPGFAFQLHGSSLQHIASLVCAVAQYFHQKDVAHNLFVTRGTVFGEPQSSTKRTIRLYLWPRKKFVGVKVVPDYFNVAVIELGGHLPIKSEEAYRNITEKYADEIIARVNLEAEEYREIKRCVLDVAKNISS